MEELLAGIHHWTAFHPKIRQRVSSYYVEPAALLIDPMLPDEGLEWFEGRTPPGLIVLTNRHHYRRSGDFAERFGCRVVTSEVGLHEFAGGPDVEGFTPPTEVAPGVTAVEVGAICPDECALHIELGEGALAFADGLIRWGDDGLGFVPDFLLGDDPEGVKVGLRAAFRRLLDLDFDTLLFAHGEPLVGGGKAALREFVA